MTSGSRTTGRFPRDVQARERLRQAQEAETRAVSAVCAAQDALAAAARKRDKAVAAGDAVVQEAERSLAATHAELVDVSGLSRACALLGLDRATLRKARAAAKSRPSGGEAA